MVDKKDVTILIAVLNKVETIRNCVESLLKIKYPVSKIMIVDGYSKDGTYEILTEYKDCIDLRQFPENLSRTFNWALNQIDTEYVALTDADCIVDQNWLNELMSGFEEKDVIAAAGFCGTVKSSFLLQTLIGLEMDSRFKRLPKYLHRAPTMNLCLKTNLAKKVRFDENQGVGVETDFGFRLTKYGKMIYVPQAKVWHNHRSSFKAYFRQQKNQAKWGVRLLLKHRTKAISDPITTLDMTAQIPIFLGTILFFVLIPHNGNFIFPAIAFFLGLTAIYVKNVLEIKPATKYYLPLLGLFLFRTFAWSYGIISGVFSWRAITK